MKKHYFLVAIGLFLSIQFSLFAQNQHRVVRGERPVIDLSQVSEDAMIPGRILIKLREEAFAKTNTAPVMDATNGGIRFGIAALDQLNAIAGIQRAKQYFYAPALGYGFSDKHRAWGFDRWYELRFDEDKPIKALIAEYRKLAEIEVAEPVYRKQRIANVRNPEPTQEAGKSTNWTPNDPRFAEQWHYHNTGQQSGTVDKDIDLPEAWELETGNSDVIVAIIDGGIQYNHPDISGNMWSGIGYNFVTNSTVIEADEHGTHVAGTVSAVNNNGTGVSGIAGGTGSNDGVRLMSCQVFTDSDADGFHLAPIYAADNGASISQNSWGYIDVGVYNQAELDGIDYFNANGGGAALDGGITIFAAGNDGSSGLWYPGCYSGVVGVAATNNNDQKAWYSNYDTWVDISAPGGETNSVTARGVLSTLSGSTYAFYQGTSMACPHTSGVAALVVSHAYGLLTAAELRDILLTTTDDHYAANPSYIGKLGTGRLNAYAAVQASEAYLSGVVNPATFTASASGTTQIDLSWTKNMSSNDVMVVWSPNGTFGAPVSGTTYTAGQTIPGGGTVLYVGSSTSFSHTGLTSSTTYYYRAFSYDGTHTYSVGKSANASTFCGIFSLPLSETFSTGTLPNCWDINDNAGNGQVWEIGSITGYTPNPGLTAPYAFLNSDDFGSGNTQNADLVSPVIDMSGFTSVTLSFNHYFRQYLSVSTASLYYSINGGSSWNLIQSWTASTANPASFSQAIPAVAGQSQVQFRWNYTGTWGYYWAVDDISITGTSSGTTLAVAPSNQDVTADAGSTTFDVTSNASWSAASNQSWCTVTNGGSGNGTITANYTANTGSSARVATITVSASGATSVQVTVTQAGVVLTPTATVILRPQQIDLSSATSRSAVLVQVSNYTTDDVKYRLYNGSNQYNCWDGSQFVTSSSYGSNPSVPGSPTTSTSWWIMFERGSNNATAASYRDRLGPSYSTNHLTVSLPAATAITSAFSIDGSLYLNPSSSYPLNQRYVILGYDAESGGNLLSATLSDPTTGVYSLYVSDASVVRRLEVRDQLNVLMESLTGTWAAGSDPMVFDFTGGGSYCGNANPTGINATLSDSESGVSYQLLKDGTAYGSPLAGTGAPLSWYDLIAGNYTVEATNSSSTTGMNGTVVVSAQTVLNVSVTIVPSADEVCQGTAITYTAYPVNGGDTPTFDWFVNGASMGSNTQTFNYIPSNGDQVQLVLTSSLSCTNDNPASSNIHSPVVLPVVEASVAIQPTETSVCAGTVVQFTALPVNGGTNPVFAWTVNGSVAGNNSSVFSYTPANNAVIGLSMTSTAACVVENPVSANPVSLTVTPTVVVTITATPDANPVCSGTTVHFSTYSNNGGSSPVYQWRVNGNPTGTGGSSFAYIPSNGDQVDVVLTSNLSCTTNNPATSNLTSMVVMNALTASVSIQADALSYCQGASSQLTAIPVNGGETPTYEWFLNGTSAGSGNQYNFIPQNNDLVQLEMTSSLACVVNNPVSSGALLLTVNPVSLTLHASPAEGGTISSTGDAVIGQSVALMASANAGWDFVNWTNQAGDVISTEASFDFPVTNCDHTLTAHFVSATSVAGRVAFYNPLETTLVSPFSNGAFYVQLYKDGNAVGSPHQVVQDQEFVFNNLETGQTYELRLWEQADGGVLSNTWTWNNWSGVSALDALIVSYMATGNSIIQNFPWIATAAHPDPTTFSFNVADVNASNSLTALDALLMMFRSIGYPGTSPFPGGRPNFQVFGQYTDNVSNLTYPNAPELVFDMSGVYTGSSAAQSVYHHSMLQALNPGQNGINIFLIPTGDVNASFTPSSTSKQSELFLTGSTPVVTLQNEVTIPVIVEENCILAAFNLNLQYDPQLIEIQSVPGYEVVYNHAEKGLLSVAWLKEDGQAYQAGDTLMVVKARLKSNLSTATALFRAGSDNVWADARAIEIPQMKISIPHFVYPPLDMSTPQMLLYPNPMHDQTRLQLQLPENASVGIKIFDNRGVLVHAQNGWFDAGVHERHFTHDMLKSPGLYFMEVQVKTADKTWMQRNKLVVIR